MLVLVGLLKQVLITCLIKLDNNNGNNKMPIYESTKGYQIASKYYKDTNCCAVVAVANACDVGIGKAFHLLNSLGRVTGKGTPPAMSKRAIQKLGFSFEYDHDYNGLTVNQLSKVIPKGTYLVSVRRHVFTIKDGKVLDWTEGRRHRVLRVAKVYK